MFYRYSMAALLLLSLTACCAATKTNSKTISHTTPFVPHRFTSSNNITILREVRDEETTEALAPPLVLNTHEVLPPQKPSKNKKPYTLLEKSLLTEYEKPRPIKEYDLHPVTFDFNLGDLEDLEDHGALKKQMAEVNLLPGDGQTNDDDNDDDDNDNEDDVNSHEQPELGLSYTELPAVLGDVVAGSDMDAAVHNEKDNATVVVVTTQQMPAMKTTLSKSDKMFSKMTSTMSTTISGTTPTKISLTLFPTTVSFTKSSPMSTTKSSTMPSTESLTPSSTTSTSSPTIPSTPSPITSNITSNEIIDLPTIIPIPTAPSTTDDPSNIITTNSDHIFKILQKNKSKIRGRELLKKDAPLGFNSISRNFGGSADTAAGGSGTTANATADSWQSSVNQFQLLTNLYDHFYWQPSEIRSKVSTGCSIELQAYLTALNANYEWAQKAYDASGRYRGQSFFGNDKWLGEKSFCYELNRQLQPDQRKHFEFQFYMALISLKVWVPGKVDLNLQLGECLPKTCSAPDVQAILSLDPHAHMLIELSADNATTAAHINILRVRKVPENFSYWMELKFQLFASFMITLTGVIIAATWYQSKLNRLNCTTVPTVSAKVADAHALGINVADNYNDKAFELYQMKTLNDNNNVDLEAGVAAAAAKLNNNNGNSNSNDTNNGKASNTTNGNTATAASKKSHEAAEVKLKAQLAADLETCSSAGATGTYEAKKKLAVHQQVLLCFAFQTNASTIMSVEDNKESQTSCVHGLRVFSVLWTILVHTFLQLFHLGENRFSRIITERSILYQFVGNATFSVDTFFFISGFLVTLLYLKQEKKYPEAAGPFMRRSCVDGAMIVIYRYIRLTPAYLAVIFFTDFSRQTFEASVLLPNTANPLSCSLYWWRNIFYINNFYPLSEICMIWSWYMANDMQFYIMASLLLIISTRYFKTTVLIISSFLFSSWAVSGIISLHHNYTHKVGNPFESFDFLYDKPWQRVGTYIMGMLAGYIIYKVKTPPKISARTNWLLWCGSLGLLFIIIFGVWQGELSVISTAFYVSLGHTAYGLGLVWIVLSCSWGLSNPINRVLSYRGLWPLSRLTYCTYLVHPVIMLFISYRMEGTVHLNNTFVMTVFLGNAVLSFVTAFFISVFFEAPVIRLLKICFRK